MEDSNLEKMDQLSNIDKIEQPELPLVQTTLYKLIAALNEEVHPAEDWFVTVAVLHLFDTGQAKFLSLN